MEKHEEYRDSGIEWIGEIPEHWKMAPIKWFTTIIAGQSPDSNLVNDFGSIPFLQGKAEFGTRVPIPKKWCDRPQRIAPAGSWLLSVRAPVGALNLADRDYGIGRGLCAVVPANSINPDYLGYCLISANEDIASQSTGSTFDAVTPDQIGLVFAPIPNLEEQQSIAKFLDTKSRIIDSLIEQTERSIELLEEYRKSVISETVTKGLNPNTPMKDSGIEWIGEIPKHWRISRIKYEFSNQDNLRQPIEASLRSQDSENLYPYYGASGIVDTIDDYIFDGHRILIGEDGANLVLRNLPLVYVAEGRYWVNNHAHVLEPLEGFDFTYAAHQLELIDLTNYITGSAQPKLSQTNLGQIPVVLPPVEEQEVIIRQIDSSLNDLKTCINMKRVVAKRLREYRKSFIAEAVTGKFKVPGVE